MSHWRAFTAAQIRVADEQNRSGRGLFIIRRANGKCNVGELQSWSGDGVVLVNGSWTYEIHYDEGPPKQFCVIEPPEFIVQTKASELPLKEA